MNIGIITDCAPVTFDNIDLALAYVKMLAHQIKPEDWLDMVRKMVPDPDGVAMAQKIVKACMGTPA